MRLLTVRDGAPGVRQAAALCMAGGAIQIAAGVLVTLRPAWADSSSAFFRYGVVLFVLVGLFTVAGLLGLRSSGAVGTGALATLGIGLAVLGRGVFIAGEVIDRISLDVGHAVLGIAEPITALGLVIAGIGVVRARVWRPGWRLIPLLCGLYTPIVLIPAFVANNGPNFLVVAGQGVLWLALGYALRSQPIGSPEGEA